MLDQMYLNKPHRRVNLIWGKFLFRREKVKPGYLFRALQAELGNTVDRSVVVRIL